MRNHNVLLIEPDYLLGKIYKDHLEKFHYSVVLCSDVQVAINETDNQKPDVIVLEIQLNGHNGYEFLYELRSYPDWVDIPVIIHSMIAETDLNLTPEKRKELGITGYLYKPSSSLGKLHYEINKQVLVDSK